MHFSKIVLASIAMASTGLCAPAPAVMRVGARDTDPSAAINKAAADFGTASAAKNELNSMKALAAVVLDPAYATVKITFGIHVAAIVTACNDAGNSMNADLGSISGKVSQTAVDQVKQLVSDVSGLASFFETGLQSCGTYYKQQLLTSKDKAMADLTAQSKQIQDALAGVFDSIKAAVDPWTDDVPQPCNPSDCVPNPTQQINAIIEEKKAILQAWHLA